MKFKPTTQYDSGRIDLNEIGLANGIAGERSLMNEAELRSCFRLFVDESRYRKFIRHCNEKCRATHRLRYWQERLWEAFAAEIEVHPPGRGELVRIGIEPEEFDRRALFALQEGHDQRTHRVFVLTWFRPATPIDTFSDPLRQPSVVRYPAGRGRDTGWFSRGLGGRCR